jgi:hypothetical protein
MERLRVSAVNSLLAFFRVLRTFVFFVVLSFIRVICAFREAEPVPKNLSVVYSPGRMADGNYLFGSG